MLKLKLKYWLKNDEVRNFIFILVISIIYLIFVHESGFLRNLSDLLFIMGIFHFVAGGGRYIKNVGLFKTFGYWAYKRRWRKHGDHNEETRPMSLAEYTMNVVWDEMNQKPVMIEFIIGAILCVLSLGIAFLTISM